MQVFVRDNNVDQALKALRKMQREGIFREVKLRGYYEKPSEKETREKAEAIPEEASDEEEQREEPEEETEAESGELVEVRRAVPAKSGPRSRPSAPTTLWDVFARRWDRSSCFRAKVKSPSPSASKPAARR